MRKKELSRLGPFHSDYFAELKITILSYLFFTDLLNSVVPHCQGGLFNTLLFVTLHSVTLMSRFNSRRDARHFRISLPKETEVARAQRS